MTGRFVEVVCNFDQVVPEIGSRQKHTSPTIMVGVRKINLESLCEIVSTIASCDVGTRHSILDFVPMQPTSLQIHNTTQSPVQCRYSHWENSDVYIYTVIVSA